MGEIEKTRGFGPPTNLRPISEVRGGAEKYNVNGCKDGCSVSAGGHKYK